MYQGSSGGTSQFVCKDWGRGPECDPPYRETAEGKQLNCLSRLALECMQEMTLCMQRLYRNFNSGCIATPFCNGVEIDLYCVQNTSCWKEIKECFCYFPLNLRCTLCKDPIKHLTPLAPDGSVGSVGGGGDNYVQLDGEIGVTASSYDAVIPRAYGRTFQAGNIIWIGEPTTTTITTTTVTETTVKTTTNEVGFLDFAIAFTASEFENIGRVWINGTQVLNGTLDVTADASLPESRLYFNMGMSVEFISGNDAQLPADILEAANPGACPGYRDLCYIVFHDYPILVKTRNLPQIMVELIQESDDDQLANVIISNNTYDANSLAIDNVSSNAFALSGGNAQGIETITLGEIVELDESNSISRVFADANGNIIYQDSANDLFVAPNGQPLFSYTLGAGVPAVSTAVGGFVYDTAETYKNIFVLASGTTVYYVENNYANRTLSLLGSAAGWTTGNIQRLLYHKIAEGSSIIKQLFAISQESDNIVVNIAVLNDEASGVLFDTSIVPTQAVIAAADYGGTGTVSLKDAIIDTKNNQIIFFCTANSQGYVFSYDYENSTVDYTVTVDGVPDKIEAFLSQDNRLVSWIKSGVIYTLDTNTGLAEANAQTIPEPSGQQFYDGELRALYFQDSTGAVNKYFVDRIASVPISLGYILTDLLDVAGVSQRYLNFTGIDDVVVEGINVNTLTRLTEYFRAFSDFSLVSIFDSGDRLKAIHKYAPDTIVLDEQNHLQETPVIKAAIPESLVTKTIVGYLDTSLIGQQFRQETVIGESNEFAFDTTEQTFTFPVLASSDYARQLSEVLQAATVLGKDSCELRLPAMWIAADVGDIVILENRTFRIDRKFTDNMLHEKWELERVELDFFEDLVGIEGVPPDYTYPFNIERKRTITNNLLVLNMPYIVSVTTGNPPIFGEYVYVGQINARPGETFVPFDVSAMNFTGDMRYVGTPTTEVLYGTATSVLPTRLNMFTFDDESTVDVEFTRDVSVADFNTIADYEQLLIDDTLNILFIGKEVIQYMDFSIAGDNRTVTFSGLLRGRFGTDDMVDTHATGEICVRYDTTSLIACQLSPLSTDDQFTTVALYDQNYPDIQKTFVIEVRPVSLKTLKIYQISRYDINTTAEINFYYEMREPYINHFTVTLPAQGVAFSNFTPAMFWLASPFDMTTFLAALAEDTHVVDTETGPSLNAYILREWQTRFFHTGQSIVTPTQAPYFEGQMTRWRQNQIVEDGFDIDNDTFYGVVRLTNNFDARDVRYFSFEFEPRVDNNRYDAMQVERNLIEEF